jgi:hypothetical protein
VGVDKYGEHAESLVSLNETHPSHVGSQVVDVLNVPDGDIAVLAQVEIEREILHVGKPLIPFLERLNIDRSNLSIAPLPKVGYETAADEPTSTGNDNEIIFHGNILTPLCTRTWTDTGEVKYL